MEKTAKQYMMEYLMQFGKLYQLTTPSPEYLETIQTALRAYGWKLGDFKNALTNLMKDDAYAESARFGKYPTIHDYLRIKRLNDSKQFYTALSRYLSGEWWEKDTINEIATPEQANAILLAGGLENLYERATGDMPTPVYKLVNIVENNEAESPSELIDTKHRIGQPSDIKQILNLN